MTATPQLEVQVREKIGRGAARALRREGCVPAVLYGGKDAPVHFSLNPIQLNKELHKTGFLSKIFEISLNGKTARFVQFHPVTDLPLHVDFFRVTKGEKIAVSVPIHFINEAASPGLKRGGVLNVIVHNLEVIADVDHIPTHIEIDLTGLEIHDTVHLKDLKLPESVMAAHAERDNDLANIVAPSVMKEHEEEVVTPAEGEEAVEAVEGVTESKEEGEA